MSAWFLLYFIYMYESVKSFSKTLIAFCLLNLINLIYDSFTFDSVIFCKHVQNASIQLRLGNEDFILI